MISTADIIDRICDDFDGVVPKVSWGETSLFYNPGQALPHGVYFCTIKEKDGENDKASKLDRDGVYRLNIGLPKPIYIDRFGTPPKRPAKGGIIDTGHDFTQVNTLMPHPIYGWMSWVCILSPTHNMFEETYPLITQAYDKAVFKFNQKTK